MDVVVFKNEGWMRALLIATRMLALVIIVSGCDQIQQRLGLEDISAKTARADAEGKAVGGACRHAGRAIEDCYSVYTWVPKDAVYSGWRDMDAYMRDNKIESVEPQLPPAQAPGSKKKVIASSQQSDGKETKAAEKAAEKH